MYVYTYTLTSISSFRWREKVRPVHPADHTISSIVSSSPLGLSAICFPRGVARYRTVPRSSADFTNVFEDPGVVQGQRIEADEVIDLIREVARRHLAEIRK